MQNILLMLELEQIKSPVRNLCCVDRMKVLVSPSAKYPPKGNIRVTYYNLPISHRISRITTTSPRPPLGP